MSATNPLQHSPPIAERARAEQADQGRVARFARETVAERRALAKADPDGEAEAVAPILPGATDPWDSYIVNRAVEGKPLQPQSGHYTPEQLAHIREVTGGMEPISNGDGSYYWREKAGAIDDEGLIVGVDEYRTAVPSIVPWVSRLAYLGGLSLLAGGPKVGKSTLASQLQRCRETGERLFGVWDVPMGPTLLVTEEGGIPVVYKTDGLHQLQILDRRAAVLAGLTFPDTLALVSKWGTTHPGGLVFIDTLAIWAGIEDENDASETTKAIAAVAVVAQVADLAVVLVHHARKAGGDNGEAIRGSGAILATVDIGIELSRVTPGSDQRFLDVQGRVIKPERFLLDFDRATAAYGLVDQARNRLDEIEGYLAGVPDDGPGITRADLSGLWGCDPRKRVEHLLNVGRMRHEYVKEGRGWGYRYWSIPPVWTPPMVGHE